MRPARLHWSKATFGLLLLLGGCKNSVPDFELIEMEPKVVLQFNLTNGGVPVELDEQFTDREGYTCSVNDLSFYASDIHLVNESGERVLLSEVELFSFIEESAGKESDFKRSYSYLIPKGKYTAIEFGVGLPPDLNASDPTTFPNDHPLGVYSNGMYWDWATLRVFLRIGVDLISGPSETYNFDMQIHTGTDSIYGGVMSYPMSLDIPAFAKDTVELNLDWNALYHVNGATAIDLSEKIFTHGTATPEDVDMAIRFITNFRNAITVDAT